MSHKEALASYLRVPESDLGPTNFDRLYPENCFQDTNENDYYIFTSKELLDHIKGDLLETVLEMAKDDLYYLTRNSQYQDLFVVDDYMAEEYCFRELEDILDAKSRESYDYEGETYVILELI